MASGMLPRLCVQVSFNTKVRYRGGEYASLADIPAEVRAPLDKALDRLTHGLPLQPQLRSCIVVNGKEFAGTNELPVEFRRLIDDSLHTLLPIDTAIALAAAREHGYARRGLAGLCTLLAGAVSVALYLWRSGYFAL